MFLISAVYLNQHNKCAPKSSFMNNPDKTCFRRWFDFVYNCNVPNVFHVICFWEVSSVVNVLVMGTNDAYAWFDAFGAHFI